MDIGDFYKNFNNNSNKESKYEDDEMYESWADVNIFFPITSNLVDQLRNMGLTPNHVTYLSTIFTFLSLYYFYLDNRVNSMIAYFIGYTLDCVDGRMARKYDMGTKYGMALDLVSDNVSNFALVSFMIRRYGFSNSYLIILSIMTYMISLSYGLNEAIASHKALSNDNFYERRLEELKNEKGILFDLFLFITKMSYNTYRVFFKEYDEDKINNWLKILKHFGPGNYCIVVCLIILLI